MVWGDMAQWKVTSTLIRKLLKTRVILNLDGSKDELFISYNKEDDVKEMIGEADQTANDGNRESFGIEI